MPKLEILDFVGIQVDHKFLAFHQIQNVLIVEVQKLFSIKFVLVIYGFEEEIQVEMDLQECLKFRYLIATIINE